MPVGLPLSVFALAWMASQRRFAAPDAASIRGRPGELSVTVYRAPSQSGSIDIGNLHGFALISETRQVHRPA